MNGREEILQREYDETAVVAQTVLDLYKDGTEVDRDADIQRINAVKLAVMDLSPSKQMHLLRMLTIHMVNLLKDAPPGRLEMVMEFGSPSADHAGETLTEAINLLRENEADSKANELIGRLVWEKGPGYVLTFVRVAMHALHSGQAE